MESKRFALLPKRVTSGKIVWLKYYFEHKELFDRRTGRAPVTSLHFTWTETAQEKTWRLLKEIVVQNRNIWNEPELTTRDKI
jgi:hypothetical protein